MVSTIFAYGEDALNNEISVSLKLPTCLGLDDLDGMLKFRAKEAKSPAVEIKTYTQTYRGYEIERWRPGREVATLDLTFRVDKYWRVYDTLYDWSKLIINLERGDQFADTNLGSALTSLRGTIILSQESVIGDQLGQGWTYYGVFPKNISDISFDTSSDGSPLDLSVSFSYINFERTS